MANQAEIISKKSWFSFLGGWLCVCVWCHQASRLIFKGCQDTDVSFLPSREYFRLRPPQTTLAAWLCGSGAACSFLWFLLFILRHLQLPTLPLEVSGGQWLPKKGAGKDLLSPLCLTCLGGSQDKGKVRWGAHDLCLPAQHPQHDKLVLHGCSRMPFSSSNSTVVVTGEGMGDYGCQERTYKP